MLAVLGIDSGEEGSPVVHWGGGEEFISADGVLALVSFARLLSVLGRASLLMAASEYNLYKLATCEDQGIP